MTLTELKYIVAVARERHFGKAAEERLRQEQVQHALRLQQEQQQFEHEQELLPSPPEQQLSLTRTTPEGRLRLAIGVVQGVHALHTISATIFSNDNPDHPHHHQTTEQVQVKLKAPIVHADLQSRQFLVSRKTGQVKINDFNRCRFMPVHMDPPHETCPFRICKFSIFVQF